MSNFQGNSPWFHKLDFAKFLIKPILFLDTIHYYNSYMVIGVIVNSLFLHELLSAFRPGIVAACFFTTNINRFPVLSKAPGIYKPFNK